MIQEFKLKMFKTLKISKSWRSEVPETWIPTKYFKINQLTRHMPPGNLYSWGHMALTLGTLGHIIRTISGDMCHSYFLWHVINSDVILPHHSRRFSSRISNQEQIQTVLKHWSVEMIKMIKRQILMGKTCFSRRN